MQHAEHPRGTVRQVDFAPAEVRAAVVDRHQDRSPVVEIGHAYLAPEGKGTVRPGQLPGVEALTAGRDATVELLAVPGGSADFCPGVRKRFGPGPGRMDDEQPAEEAQRQDLCP